MQTHQHRPARVDTEWQEGRRAAASVRPSSGQPTHGHGTSSLLHLQRTAGNTAVTELLRSPEPGCTPAAPVSGEHRSSTAIQSLIPRPRPAAGAADRDAESGGAPSTAPDAVTGALMSTLAPAPAAQPGDSVALPDIVMPASLGVADPDSVSGTIAYAPTVTQAGVVNPFGSTTWNVFNMTGIRVTAGTGAYAVTAQLENPITYNVSSPKTSIASDADPALKSGNYAKAASDLTPDMSRQGGRPPRTRFWAYDLTSKHENFHARERQGFGATGTTQAQAWLATQTAASVDDVQRLLAAVPARVIASSRAAAGTVDEKETRAYGDGAPAYKARADAIKTKGDANGYPD